MIKKIIVVASDRNGNIDVADRIVVEAAEHGPQLAALMVTYPSTHGVSTWLSAICKKVHAVGGQACYMDGANPHRAGRADQPGLHGADVCHMNLVDGDLFCILHGGGGPGMGPIAVARHLAPYLPNHPCDGSADGHAGALGASAAPYGGALISTTSWMYIRMMAPVPASPRPRKSRS
ncbi:MAG: hypothetical protein R3E68_21590 [Burkholderiaceae bacterium]